MPKTPEIFPTCSGFSCVEDNYAAAFNESLINFATRSDG
jgi:hypothetical protein